MSDVMPDNKTPILKCQGAIDCGFTPHRFLRSVRSTAVFNAVRQMFSCSRCGHERLWGVVDQNATGARLVQ